MQCGIKATVWTNDILFYPINGLGFFCFLFFLGGGGGGGGGEGGVVIVFNDLSMPVNRLSPTTTGKPIVAILISTIGFPILLRLMTAGGDFTHYHELPSVNRGRQCTITVVHTASILCILVIWYLSIISFSFGVTSLGQIMKQFGRITAKSVRIDNLSTTIQSTTNPSAFGP